MNVFQFSRGLKCQHRSSVLPVPEGSLVNTPFVTCLPLNKLNRRAKREAIKTILSVLLIIFTPDSTFRCGDVYRSVFPKKQPTILRPKNYFSINRKVRQIFRSNIPGSCSTIDEWRLTSHYSRSGRLRLNWPRTCAAYGLRRPGRPGGELFLGTMYRAPVVDLPSGAGCWYPSGPIRPSTVVLD